MMKRDNRKQPLIMIRCMVALVVMGLSASMALASYTPDRQYWMGDDNFPNSDGTFGEPDANDNKPPVAGIGVIRTRDSFGSDMDNYGDFQDLTATGSPTYVDVSSRPGSKAGNLGIQFDGVDDYLMGANLNIPSSSQAAIGSNDFGTPGPLNYTGITDRGLQLWVNPTSSDGQGAGHGVRQNIVMDSNQHGVIITANDTWGMVYSGGTVIDSGVAVDYDGWQHVMVARPFGNAGGSRMYIDGVAVASRGGGYTGNGDIRPLVVGSNTAGDMGEFTGGTTDFFKGIVDDLEMFVLGDNTNDPNGGGQDWGTFDLLTDNNFVSEFLYNGVVGDANQDGVLDQADVNAIVTGWGLENIVTNALALGDMTTYAQGDMNVDGVVDIFDWTAMRRAFIDDGQAAPEFKLVQVPEPATLALLGLGGLSLLRRKRVAGRHAVASASKQSAWMAVLLVFGLAISTASAETISINWQSFDGNAMTANQKAGVVGDDNWNNAPSDALVGSVADLLNGNGNSTGASADWEAGFIGTNAHDPSLGGDYAMNSGWYGTNNNVDTRNDPGTLNINSIPTSLTGGGGYDLYIYLGSATRNRTMKFILNDQTIGPALFATENPNVFNGLYTEATGTDYTNATVGNYVVFRGLTDTDLTIFGEMEDNARTAIRGIQITNEAPRAASPVLTVDRITGAMSLSNETGDPVLITAYTLTSGTETLDPSQWTSVSNTDSDWTELSTTSDELSEGTFQETVLADSSSISLGNTWRQYNTEDVQMLLALDDDSVIAVPVVFTGNDGNTFELGDMDFNGLVDESDWAILRTGFGSDTSALTLPEGYALGDMDGSGIVDRFDFDSFKTSYDAANGAGAFDAMLASVPEPATLAFLSLGSLFALRRRRQSGKTTYGENQMRVVRSSVRCSALVAVLILVGLGSVANAQSTLFDLGEANPDMTWEGLTTGSLTVDGITFSLDAIGEDAIFDTNAGGTGISSTPDGGTSTALRRINGSYDTPEAVQFSFDADIEISAFEIGSISTDGSETMILQFVSGDNPFTNLNGYTGDYVLGADSLSISPSGGGGGARIVPVGQGDQDPLTIKAGTVLALTTSPVVNGGILFNTIEVTELILPMTLQVNKTTGATSIVNESGADFDIDFYEITSAAGSLTPGSWDSLEDQDFEGNGTSTGNGDGWEELNDENGWLAEGFLQGSSVIADSQSVDLGNVFANGSDEDLQFVYRTASGNFLTGTVEYVEGGVILGDVNGDGLVNGFDVDPFVDVLLNGPYQIEADVNEDGAVNGFDVDPFVALVLGGGSAPQGTEVPEPATLVLLGLGGLAAMRRKRM